MQYMPAIGHRVRQRQLGGRDLLAVRVPSRYLRTAQENMSAACGVEPAGKRVASPLDGLASSPGASRRGWWSSAGRSHRRAPTRDSQIAAFIGAHDDAQVPVLRCRHPDCERVAEGVASPHVEICARPPCGRPAIDLVITP